MTKKEEIKQVNNHLWFDITNNKLKKTTTTHIDCAGKLTPEEIEEWVNRLIKLAGWQVKDCTWELKK